MTKTNCPLFTPTGKVSAVGDEFITAIVQGKTYRQIAAMLRTTRKINVSHVTVKRWHDRYGDILMEYHKNRLRNRAL